MRNVQRRVEVLERLPHFQPRAGPLHQIRALALRHISDEDLALMITVRRDEEAGVRRALSQKESAALAAYQAALETEARRMGFRSVAEAERREG